jgi:hypothetical protein
VDLGRFFSFLIYTQGPTPWTGDQPVAKKLPTHRTTLTQNKRTQTSMRRMGFDPTVPVFKWAKTVHAWDRAATVIGILLTERTVHIQIQYWFKVRQYLIDHGRKSISKYHKRAYEVSVSGTHIVLWCSWPFARQRLGKHCLKAGRGTRGIAWTIESPHPWQQIWLPWN